MLNHSQALVNRPVSFAQIDALRNELGLHRYKKQAARDSNSRDQKKSDLAMTLPHKRTTSAAEAIIDYEAVPTTEKSEASHSVTATDDASTLSVVDGNEPRTRRNDGNQDIPTDKIAEDVNIAANETVQPIGIPIDTSLESQSSHDIPLHNKKTWKMDDFATRLKQLSTGEDQTWSKTCPDEPMILSESMLPPPPDIQG